MKATIFSATLYVAFNILELPKGHIFKVGGKVVWYSKIRFIM